MEREEDGASNGQDADDQLDNVSTTSSIYSADGGKASSRITGKVQMGVWWKNNVLFVSVVRAKGLAPIKSASKPNPYVKTYLLPDRTKHTKRKTGIQRNTVNPQFNEILKNKLSREEIGLMTLWMSVWDWDKHGSNRSLGEVRLPLNSLDLSSSAETWYSLREKNDQDEIKDRGKLKVAVKFCPFSTAKDTKGNLFVCVKEASGLPIMDPISQTTDASVKIYLLPNRSAFSGKKSTDTVNGDVNPVWNQEFEYKRVSVEDLTCDRVLELSVWDFDRRGCKDFIGCLRLGPSPDKYGNERDYVDSMEREVEQWEAMLASPGEWVEYEHDLRPSMRSLVVQEQEEEEFADECETQETLDDDSSTSDAKPSSAEAEDRGKLNLALMFAPGQSAKKGSLHVHIKSAEDLPNMDRDSLTDGFVKMLLLPNRSEKKKSRVVKDNLNPVWDQKFTFKDVSLEDLWFKRVLQLTVWDHDLLTFNDFIGGLRFGSNPSKLPHVEEWMDSTSKEAEHWEEMLNQPGEWVERTLYLRRSVH